MKPDKKTCLNCGKEVGSRQKYCDDACRMAYSRNPNKSVDLTNKTEHKPEQPTRTSQEFARTNDEFRAGLTKTDKTFYDRAVRDFQEPYYKFGGALREEQCIHCGARFTTSLSMLRFCSYAHYSAALSTRV